MLQEIPTYPPLTKAELSIPRIAEVIFACSPAQRHALIHRTFSADCSYYNTFVRRPPVSCTCPHGAMHVPHAACLDAQLTVEGADQIFGLVTFWAAVNRKVEIRVVRMGEQQHGLHLLRMT